MKHKERGDMGTSGKGNKKGQEKKGRKEWNKGEKRTEKLPPRSNKKGETHHHNKWKATSSGDCAKEGGGRSKYLAGV